MPQEQISGRQLWFILFMMRSSIIISFFPILTSAEAGRNAWLSGILVFFGSEIFIILLNSLDQRFPGQTIIEYSPQIIGKIPGKILGLLILWLFLQISIIEIRLYGELIITGFLPETPMLFIIGIMVFASFFCIHNGVEVLGRTADFIFFIFILILIGIILTPLKEFNINNLQPVMAQGIKPVLRGTIVPLGLISQVWVIGILNTITKKNPKYKYWIPITSIGLSLLLMIIIVFITIGVIGAYEGSRASFPILTLMRSIIFTHFLERTEIIIIFGWGMGLFISVSTFLYCGARGIADWFNLNDYKFLLLPMSIIWIYMSNYSFTNIFTLYKFMSPQIFGPYGLSLLLGPLLILWTGYLVKSIYRKIKGW
ncbi:MAG: GerAB/ArcD/ProY family transporter [Bacillota bacterium]